MKFKLLDLFFFFFHRPAWSLLGEKKSVKQRIKLVWPSYDLCVRFVEDSVQCMVMYGNNPRPLMPIN